MGCANRLNKKEKEQSTNIHLSLMQCDQLPYSSVTMPPRHDGLYPQTKLKSTLPPQAAFVSICHRNKKGDSVVW